MKISLTDSKDISKFLKTEWGDFFGERRIKKKDKLLFFKVEEANEIVAAAVLNIKNEIGFLDDFLVGKNYRGQGTGRRLLQEIEEAAKQEDCKKILLKTSDIHKEAKEFYLFCGYQQIAMLPDLWYGANWYFFYKRL